MIQHKERRDGHAPPLSQPCWNCKRAIPCKEQCQWAADSKPIKGWVAEKRTIKESANKPFETYMIKSCPLYLEDEPWGCDYSDVVEWLKKTFGVSQRTAYYNYFSLLVRYEEETKKTLPLWLWEKGRVIGDEARTAAYSAYAKSKRKMRSEENK